MRFFIGILLLEAVLARQFKCGKNARYTSCGTACSLTCDTLDNPPESCDARCRRGCQCEEGFVKLRPFLCVKPEDCPISSSQPTPNVVIKDGENRILENIAGPYNEGDFLLLVCETEAGNMTPSLSWWTENNLIDDSFSQTSEGLIRNELLIVRLRRSNFMQEFNCEMRHPNLTQSIKASVKIDMNLKPLYVSILTKQKPINLGEELTLDCKTEGSVPKSKIVWWIDNEQIREENQSVSSQRIVNSISDDKVTFSSITFTPGIDDNGRAVICKVENPAFPRLDIRDTWILHVHYNVCGENEFYNECGSPCPLTCENYDTTERMCPDVCDEGCDCKNGYIRRADGRCVKPEHCPDEQTEYTQHTTLKTGDSTDSLTDKILVNCTDCPDTGLCNASLSRFYYDSDEQSCKEFIFGGCGGNTNNFESLEVCKATCGVKILSDCSQAKAVGNCENAFPRYFFNHQTGQCESFIYSGCGGSSNNFDLMEECEEVCLN